MATSLTEQIDELGEGLLLLEPRSQFDPCILGVVQRYTDAFVIYDRSCVLQAIVDQDEDMTEEDAFEHWSYNMVGGWVGESTPGYLIEVIRGGDDEPALPVRDLASGH